MKLALLNTRSELLRALALLMKFGEDRGFSLSMNARTAKRATWTNAGARDAWLLAVASLEDAIAQADALDEQSTERAS